MWEGVLYFTPQMNLYLTAIREEGSWVFLNVLAREETFFASSLTSLDTLPLDVDLPCLHFILYCIKLLNNHKTTPLPKL